jgi:hypothetical protein
MNLGLLLILLKKQLLEFVVVMKVIEKKKKVNNGVRLAPILANHALDLLIMNVLLVLAGADI